jgi:predicted metal-dependent hydrolase
MDKTQIPLGGRMVPLSIRRHRRARRISLRLSPARDAVVMTLPLRASVASGLAFFHSKSQWVLTHVEPDAVVELKDGAVIPVLGEEYVIRRMEGRGVSHIAGSEIRVHCAPEFTARRVRDFLKAHLREAALAQAQAMAAILGKPLRSVKIRDTRSRWGSCSRGGLLTFHWQLAFAPPAILRYIIAHEVAHLAHMNHGPRFWQAVAALYPDYPAARRWLREEGHILHRYGP